jgi:hypothetical protein
MYKQILDEFEQVAQLVTPEELEVIASQFLDTMEKVADEAVTQLEKLG